MSMAMAMSKITRATMSNGPHFLGLHLPVLGQLVEVEWR